MEAIVNAQVLSRSLAGMKLSGKFSRRCDALPILECAHLAPCEGGVLVTLTNLSTSASVLVPGDASGPPICLPFTELAALAKNAGTADPSLVAIVMPVSRPR